MTPAQARTFAAVCGLTFACDKRALTYLLTPTRSPEGDPR